MNNEISEYVILVTRADGSKVMRGLPGGDREAPDAAVLDAEARAWGGIEAHITGVVSGPATTKITEVDYAPDGTKVFAVTRLIGESCDCGKGPYCPQYGDRYPKAVA